MNKKKICIGIIVTLVVIGLVYLLVIFLNKKDTTTVDNSKTETSEEKINEIDKTEELDNENVDDTDKDEDLSEVNETPLPETTSPTPTVTEKPQTVASPKQETSQKKVTPTPVVQKQENTENKQTIATPTIQVETQGTEEKSESNTPTIKPEKPEEPKETFSVNYEMIEKMKQTIKANESEYMKNYGYEIKVDSSIKGLTNPFTYTELRIKNMVKNKFGTIRIYAENYYVGGQLIMVDCYIM